MTDRASKQEKKFEICELKREMDFDHFRFKVEESF